MNSKFTKRFKCEYCKQWYRLSSTDGVHYVYSVKCGCDLNTYEFGLQFRPIKELVSSYKTINDHKLDLPGLIFYIEDKNKFFRVMGQSKNSLEYAYIDLPEINLYYSDQKQLDYLHKYFNRKYLRIEPVENGNFLNSVDTKFNFILWN
jgi:hypothetical protein